MSATFTRAFALDDIAIRAGGDGRTVEAYAAVFDTETTINDRQGVYREQISRTAFSKTLADNGIRFGVFYNHGLTIQGTPSERGSVPIGVPLEVTADARGLRTVTRYNESDQAREVLAAIRNGDITGQSFSGRFVDSTPPLRRGQLYRPAPDGTLTLVTRTQIALREYGPTPIPAYEVPMITGVRSQRLARMDPAKRAEVLLSLDLLLDTDDAGECDCGCGVCDGTTCPGCDCTDCTVEPSSSGTDAMSAASDAPPPRHAVLTPSSRARVGLIARGIL